LDFGLNAEIISERFHPDNIAKFNGWGIDVSDHWGI